MSTTTKDEQYPALRISQLDASELDSELHGILKAQFLGAFRYLPSNFLDKIEPELNALLRLAIWSLSLKSNGSTNGQQMLALKYKNTNRQIPSDWITNHQKYMYAAATVGLAWLKDRSSTLFAKLPGNRYFDAVQKGLDICEKCHKVFSLVNFLVFLSKGKHQFVLERLLNIRAVYPERQMVRQVSFEFMSRELLWHGFAEFLFFIVPFVNFRRLKNTFTKLFATRTSSGMTSRCPADYKKCVVCEEWPSHPQQTGCSHVFCYYCVTANLKADPTYCCPTCGSAITDVTPVLLTVGQ